MTSVLSPIQDIIGEIRAGRMVILVDEEDRENEGDLVMAAEHITPEAVNFMARYGRGLICLTLTEARCQQLGLSLMARDNKSAYNTAFTVSIEAAEGVTTGISAQDRAVTVQAAVSRKARPEDIVQPGHIFPLQARPGGVLVRAGHTEAGCDLAGLAGLEPSAVICEILKDDGSMARLPDLLVFAQEHGLKIGAIRDLIHYRAQSERVVNRVGEKQVNIGGIAFRLCAYADTSNGEVHLALARGDIRPEEETLVRVHEPISVLDFLDSKSGRHSFSIEQAVKAVTQHGTGVIVMLHRPESGEDLLAGFADVPAGNRPAAKWDPRSFGIGAQILRDLGVGKMRLLSSPRKLPSMRGFGLEVCGYLAPEEV